MNTDLFHLPGRHEQKKHGRREPRQWRGGVFEEAESSLRRWQGSSTSSELIYGAPLAIGLIQEKKIPASERRRYRDEWSNKFRESVKAHYDDTQTKFKNRGITSFDAYRGLSINEKVAAALLVKGGDIQIRPTASWTMAKSVATLFATKSGGAIRKERTVPVVLRWNMPARNAFAAFGYDAFGIAFPHEREIAGMVPTGKLRIGNVENTVIRGEKGFLVTVEE